MFPPTSPRKKKKVQPKLELGLLGRQEAFHTIGLRKKTLWIVSKILYLKHISVEFSWLTPYKAGRIVFTWIQRYFQKMRRVLIGTESRT